MDARHIIDKRQVRLEDISKEGFIPFLGGRPKRDLVINEEDMSDLRINLNVTKSVEEFLALIKEVTSHE
jgi:hypothetical protein